ncbi:aspartate aminotransferase family protein [Streptomyces sp. CS113]|uniref:aminotransferase class III-fold pyridoxal phosphate-dependent enzyme n=1 Tax=Streptomyces sp. CS113 TaxID=1982761 RepID=UPI000B41E55A|nr:aminotransferase class III-fold pyridoxal phosphate-dependent enzyme [Streptomyces sp. CS113]OWA12333.1 aspartate aminotransferase family protein [Streptomyces sp. CS113]
MAETAYEGLAGARSEDGGFEDSGFEDGRSEDGARVPAGAGGAPRRQPAREAAARTYARALPVVPVRARGLTIEDAAGRRYLDCASGAGTLALGHHHPVVLEAMRRVLDSETPLQVMGLTTPVEDAFVTELLRTLPPRLADHARVRFCRPGGSDPVDTAVALVRAASGRAPIVTPTGAHFGAAAEACCPSGGGEPPAGVVLEPVRSADGVLPVPDAWLRDLRRVTAERSVPLIADETETGVGRTGALWAVDHSGVTPDVLILSKAIGGSLPLAAVVHHEDLDGRRTGSDRHTVGAPGAGTFRGNQLALAAGAATLAHVREQRLAEHAAALGGRMLSRLRGLAAEFACVGNVRGRGLMIGVELVSPDGAPDGAPSGGPRSDGIPSDGIPSDSTPSDGSPSGGIPSVGGPPGTGSELAVAVQRECLRRGLIVALTGPDRNVVRLLPPLIITEEQASTILDRFADAVRTVDRRRGGHAPPHRAHAAR